MRIISKDDIRKAMGKMEEKPFIEHFVSEGKSMWRIGDLWTGNVGKEEFDRVMLEESKNFTTSKEVHELDTTLTFKKIKQMIEEVQSRPYKPYEYKRPAMSEEGNRLFDEAIREEMASRNITIQPLKPKHLRGSNYTKPKKRNKK